MGYQALPESEEILLSVHPDHRMHHCGHLAFGPKDGLLYICIGGTQDNRTAQRYRALITAAHDLTRPHDEIIRLDLAPGSPGRSLPALADEEGVPGDFWAYGLRDPWRFAFDPETGDLFIPDLGRYRWEELNYRPASEDGPPNYRWPLAEGSACVRAAAARTWFGPSTSTRAGTSTGNRSGSSHARSSEEYHRGLDRGRGGGVRSGCAAASYRWKTEFGGLAVPDTK